VQAHTAAFGITAYGIDSPKNTGSLSDTQIIRNTVHGGKHGAIGVKGGARNVDVIDNRIDGAIGDGVFLHTGGDNLPPVQQITVKNNTIRNIGRNGVFATGRDILVDGNTISDCKASGIYVGNNITVTNNTITNARPGILVDGNGPRIVRKNTLINSGIGLNVLSKDKTGISDNVTK
jgi:parallel beta-helix repeat protein